MNLTEQIAKITTWKSGGQRAPHKPLLLLLALARVQRGDEQYVLYEEVETKLTELLLDFGPPRKSVHPNMPFWRLQNDGDFWHIVGRSGVEARGLTSAGDAKVSALRAAGAAGGFSSEAYALLKASPQLVAELTHQLLTDHFPTSMHDELLDAVEMPWVVSNAWVKRTSRDPAFREAILRIYGYKCAVCDFDGRMGQRTVGVEAAHVKWHAAGGPDVESNGIALCSLHHKLFDRGGLGLDAGRRVRVSQMLNGTATDRAAWRHIGRLVVPLIPGAPVVAESHIAWHAKEVFKEPALEVDLTS